MKKTRKIICVILSIATVMSMIWIPSYASSFSTTGTTTINPSNAQLRAGEKPKYRNQFETINDSIGVPYECDVFHYIVPVSGEYLVFTTGSLDTVGKLYKYKWPNNWPAQTGEIDDNYGNSLGRTTWSQFYTKITLTAGENLYIVIRGYSANTGSYQLHIEPYRDKLVSATGGLWEDYQFTGLPSMAMSSNPCGSAVYRQWYFTADQAAALFDFYSTQLVQNLIDLYWRSQGTGYVIARAIQDNLTNISYLDLTGLLSWIPGVSQGVGILSAILDFWCQAQYEESVELTEFLSQIQVRCGLYRLPVQGTDNGHTGSGGIWYARQGLTFQTKVERYISTKNWQYTIYSIRFSNINYKTYDSNEMYGAPFIHSGWRVTTDYIITGDYIVIN